MPPARMTLRTDIFLAADRNDKKPMTAPEAAVIYHTASITMQNLKMSCTDKGFEASLYRKDGKDVSCACKGDWRRRSKDNSVGMLCAVEGLRIMGVEVSCGWNGLQRSVARQFSVDDACPKLKRLYDA